MSAEGVGRLFAVDKITTGPLPEHYEPIESPIDTNPCLLYTSPYKIHAV